MRHAASYRSGDLYSRLIIAIGATRRKRARQRVECSWLERHLLPARFLPIRLRLLIATHGTEYRCLPQRPFGWVRWKRGLSGVGWRIVITSWSCRENSGGDSNCVGRKWLLNRLLLRRLLLSRLLLSKLRMRNKLLLLMMLVLMMKWLSMSMRMKLLLRGMR